MNIVQTITVQIARCVVCVFIRLKETSRGLASDSESSFEAAHIDFDRVWLRYMVRDVNSPNYAYRPQLRQAVLSFNASHIPNAVHFNDEGRDAAGFLEQSDQSGIQEGPGQVR